MNNPIQRYPKEPSQPEKNFETQLRGFTKEASLTEARVLFEQHADETKQQYALAIAAETVRDDTTAELARQIQAQARATADKVWSAIEPAAIQGFRGAAISEAFEAAPAWRS